MYLAGKTAIITGISKGLGKAFAQALLKQDVQVIGWGRNAPGYEHNHLHFIPCDITDPEMVEYACHQSLKLSSRMDILVNNAGLGHFGPVEAMTVEQWRQIMDLNLTGTFLVTRAIVPHMKKRTSGHIVVVSSTSGKYSMPEGSAYNASKFGVRGFADALFKELRFQGIKVTTLFPGSTQTNFFDETDKFSVHDKMMRSEEVAHTLVHVLDTPPNYLIQEVEMRALDGTLKK